MSLHILVLSWSTKENLIWKLPSGHSMSNQRRFDVDITWIRRRPNFDKFPRHFHVLFRCNFADQKIHVVSRYFFQLNFYGWKIHVVSTYFFQCNFDVQKIRFVSSYFFQCNFDGRKSTLFPCTFFDVILMVEKFTLLPRAFYDVIFSSKYPLCFCLLISM